MSDIYPSLMNNIFAEVIIKNSGNSNIKYRIRFPSVYQEQKISKETEVVTKVTPMSLLNYFIVNRCFPKFKSNIECWLFLPHITHLNQ